MTASGDMKAAAGPEGDEDCPPNRPELADDLEFRARFRREAVALGKVRGICTVRVVEADSESPRPFLVTEYAEGPSLAEWVGSQGPLPAEMLYGLATGLAEALVAIHAAGIVHRDLKPGNVLLTETGLKSSTSASPRPSTRRSSPAPGQPLARQASWPLIRSLARRASLPTCSPGA